MSIRLIAKDLYKAQQTVDQLEKKLDVVDASKKNSLEFEMKMAVKERDLIRRMLDGEKESGTFRKRFDGFGETKS